MKRLPLLLVLLGALTYGGFVASALQQQPPEHDPVAKAAGVPRSPHWPKVRDAFLAGHPECAVCGCKDGCEVHHVQPFHLHRDLELDPANLITLCRDHHFLFGHLDSWKSWNPTVREDAAAWRKKIKERP